jgi:hypothetical protein
MQEPSTLSLMRETLEEISHYYTLNQDLVESYIVPFDCSSQTRVVALARSRNIQCLISHCHIRHVRTSMCAITSL